MAGGPEVSVTAVDTTRVLDVLHLDLCGWISGPGSGRFQGRGEEKSSERAWSL